MTDAKKSALEMAPARTVAPRPHAGNVWSNCDAMVRVTSTSTKIHDRLARISIPNNRPIVMPSPIVTRSFPHVDYNRAVDRATNRKLKAYEHESIEIDQFLKSFD